MHSKIETKSDFIGAVVGMVLGDGYICPVTKRNPNARLSFGHSLEQESYLDYKLSILEFLTSTNKYYKIQNLPNKSYQSVCGSTKCHPLYSKIRSLMYNGNIKIVNRKILDKLTPLGLALWYMDAGHCNVDSRKKISRPTIDLSTCSFLENEHITIQQYFNEVWDIKTSIHKKRSYFRTYINHKNCIIFMNIIKDHICENMLYKVLLSISSGTTSEKEG